MIYTIGHSNHSSEQFISLLRVANIDTLVDVRIRPYSSRFPHFSQDPLRESLQNVNMAYHWEGRHLGGQRHAKPDSRHFSLADESNRGYADHMETPQFASAAQQLIHLARKSRLVLMCAEKDASHCHRALLCDYLLLQGVEVVHLLADGGMLTHNLNELARRESQALIYDRFQSPPLQLFWFGS